VPEALWRSPVLSAAKAVCAALDALDAALARGGHEAEVAIPIALALAAAAPWPGHACALRRLALCLVAALRRAAAQASGMEESMATQQQAFRLILAALRTPAAFGEGGTEEETRQCRLWADAAALEVCTGFWQQHLSGLPILGCAGQFRIRERLLEACLQGDVPLMATPAAPGHAQDEAKARTVLALAALAAPCREEEAEAIAVAEAPLLRRLLAELSPVQRRGAGICRVRVLMRQRPC